MPDFFTSILQDQKKTPERTKKDLQIPVVLSDIRSQQQQDGKVYDDAGGKVYRVSEITVTDKAAREAALENEKRIEPLPAELLHHVPLTLEEREQKEREAFERHFGLGYEAAIDGLISKGRKGKPNENELPTPPEQPKGPNEGRQNLEPWAGVEAARVWHPELFPDEAAEPVAEASPAVVPAKPLKKKKNRKKDVESDEVEATNTVPLVSNAVVVDVALECAR